MKSIVRVVALATMVTAGACASAGGGAQQEIDPNLPFACVDIDNRQGGGMLERIYMVAAERREGGSQGGGFSTAASLGDGVRVGDAPFGRVTRWCTQNVNMPGRYFLRIERTSADNLDPADRFDPSAGTTSGFGGGARTDMVRETQDFLLEAYDVWTWDVRQDRWTCERNGARASGGDC